MRTQIGWTVGLAGVAALYAMMIGSRDARDAAPPAAPETDHVAALQHEAQALPWQTPNEPRAGGAAGAAATPLAPPPVDPPEHAVMLEQRMQREARDPAAQAAATALQDSLRGEDYAALTVTTECRSTLCRVHFEGAGEAAEVAMRKLPFGAPWSAEGLTAFDIETREGDFYLAREGFSLAGAPHTTL